MSQKPLSVHAIAALDDLRRNGPQPRQAYNPGVCGTIEGRGLVESYMGPTPYRTRKGDIAWLRITEAGVAEVIAADTAKKARP